MPHKLLKFPLIATVFLVVLYLRFFAADLELIRGSSEGVESPTYLFYVFTHFLFYLMLTVLFALQASALYDMRRINLEDNSFSEPISPFVIIATVTGCLLFTFASNTLYLWVLTLFAGTHLTYLLTHSALVVEKSDCIDSEDSTDERARAAMRGLGIGVLSWILALTVLLWEKGADKTYWLDNPDTERLQKVSMLVRDNAKMPYSKAKALVAKALHNPVKASEGWVCAEKACVAIRKTFRFDAPQGGYVVDIRTGTAFKGHHRFYLVWRPK